MSSDKSRLDARRLMNSTVGEQSLGEVCGFLATTFDFNPDFFETDFLPSLLGIGAWDNRAWASRIALEKKLSCMESATVFAEAVRYQGRPRSLRLEHVPVELGAGRRLHAKVALTLYERGCRLVVSSANLTTSGYRSNRECAAAFTVSPDNTRDVPLVRQAVEGMRASLSTSWTEGADRIAQSTLATLDRLGADARPGAAQFVWSGGDRSLMNEFLSALPKEELKALHIVSPYWPADPGKNFLDVFLGRLRDEGRLSADTKLHLMTEAWPSGENRYAPVLTAEYAAFDFKRYGIRAVAEAVDPSVTMEEVDFRKEFVGKRALHAKIVIAMAERVALVYVGSANFTRRGWGIGIPPERANIEAGVLLTLRADDQLIQHLLPETVGDPVPLDKTPPGKLIEPRTSEPDQAWPTFVKAVSLVEGSDERDRLRLRIDLDPERVSGPWRVQMPVEPGETSQRDLIDRTSADEGRIERELSPDMLGQLLKQQEVMIRWWGNEVGSPFPINVCLGTRDGLPVAPGTGMPQEQHLIAYYQGRIAWEDLFSDPSNPDAAQNLEREAAPDSGVDTTGIQSYQIREFVEALQGIEDDLRNAAGSPFAMRSVLFGPVSPIQLGRVIQDSVLALQRTPTAGAFQIVEIIRCLQAAASAEVQGQHAAQWRSLIQEAVSELRDRLDRIAQAFPEEFQSDSSFRIFEQSILALHEANCPK